MRLRNAFVAICLICAPALAASEARSGSYRPDITVGPAISTLGLGGDVGVRFNDYIGLRIAGNAYLTSFDTTYDGIDYEIDFTLASVGPMLDVYPFGSVLRFTAGFRYNMNGVDVSATPAGSYVIGGTTYTAADVGKMNGEVSFNRFSPYVGLGLELSMFDDFFALGLDGGVLFQGSPSVSLSTTGALSGNSAFQADLKEEEEEIEDELSFLAYYPVIRLYATFRF